MKRERNVKTHSKNAVQNYDDESEVLNIEDLTEVQGGIADKDAGVPEGGSCGLGCFQGSGGVEPTDVK
jgi:hypothetical protein